jgi:GNAT superfamily N-acetyltransferase
MILGASRTAERGAVVFGAVPSSYDRFDAGFDPSEHLSRRRSAHASAGLLLLAWLRGAPVGCGALKLHGKAPAEIKRMWVSPSVRGLGLGRRILRELEDRA